ncbi:response regulator [Clostridium magnum]|uniref:Stage 0 sporulation protein A homolog n=1 Tax=Clostridium magnum DSM 2767 TaxID=1121326 RepID=A0A161WKT8_9CLOT|nr:response regulator [Clostridium magnum]KZL92345.1 chemotaxis protein CheY [Clostridium magnum DSM 2767]SHH12658.1 Response regulator receiver domain-containing protein [Clostridium magnum DSM 2767]
MKESYKILIVDDEEGVLTSLGKRLILEGYSVDTYSDSLNALEKFKEEKYHIAIIDIVMPNIDGIYLLKEIKAYDALTQVIMVTGQPTMNTTIQALELGANDYILKPFKSIDYVVEVVGFSVGKLERWKESMRNMIV